MTAVYYLMSSTAVNIGHTRVAKSANILLLAITASQILFYPSNLQRKELQFDLLFDQHLLQFELHSSS
jgi:hypothetical protein